MSIRVMAPRANSILAYELALVLGRALHSVKSVNAFEAQCSSPKRRNLSFGQKEVRKSKPKRRVFKQFDRNPGYAGANFADSALVGRFDRFKVRQLNSST